MRWGDGDKLNAISMNTVKQPHIGRSNCVAKRKKEKKNYKEKGTKTVDTTTQIKYKSASQFCVVIQCKSHPHKFNRIRQ